MSRLVTDATLVLPLLCTHVLITNKRRRGFATRAERAYMSSRTNLVA